MAKTYSVRRLLMGEEAWAEHQKERLKRNSDAQTERDKNSRKVMRYRRAMKARLIEYKGGKCQICGYSKPFPSAYHFHHRDQKTKSFNISAKGCTLKFETLQNEVDKCDLLCANCHSELHDQQHQNNEFLASKDLQDREERQPYQEIIKKCEWCALEFVTKYPCQLYCNSLCRSRYYESVNQAIIAEREPVYKEFDPDWRKKPNPKVRKVQNRPTIEEIEEMRKTMSWCAIGRKYGVSDNAVRKWARK